MIAVGGAPSAPHGCALHGGARHGGALALATPSEYYIRDAYTTYANSPGQDTLLSKPFDTPILSGYSIAAAAELTSAYGAMDNDFANMFDRLNNLSARRNAHASATAAASHRSPTDDDRDARNNVVGNLPSPPRSAPDYVGRGESSNKFASNYNTPIMAQAPMYAGATDRIVFSTAANASASGDSGSGGRGEPNHVAPNPVPPIAAAADLQRSSYTNEITPRSGKNKKAIKTGKIRWSPDPIGNFSGEAPEL